ncbi:MAG: DTW domain-containing protein YfiP [Pseudohongiellaceae bacterium]|jgi:DTW domain-containing protein YfiP
MTGRKICSACQYPTVVCVCSAITQIAVDVEIIILQHPYEKNRAKNTARLISLVVPDAIVVVGESAADFEQIKQRLTDRESAGRRVAVLFPSPDSTILSENLKTASNPVQTLILIDGTWRKAKKMWQLNPWLWSLGVFRLEAGSESRYRIRKGSEAGGLSTLEAAALALEIVEDANTAPLYKAFEAMQDKWQQFSGSE